MSTSRAQHTVETVLKNAGVEINGHSPHDIQVHEPDFYTRILSNGSLGFGEAYMDGWWDSERIDELVTRIFLANIEKKIVPWTLGFTVLWTKMINRQRHAKAFNIGKAHYDIGNNLYERMLDPRMVYTCGYWKNATTLDEAQEAKLDLVCKKITLKKGDHILDIGCGWGSFAKFAAEQYGATVVGITVSKEQKLLGDDLCKGLPIDIRLQDYRDIPKKEQFDHIVSLGMFEHVGQKNYRTYMQIVRRHLKDSGLFLLHTIGSNTSTTTTDPWIEKYIFPGSHLPSIHQIGAAIEGQFIMEDWHNFSADYDKTLMAWFHNFDSHWSEIEAQYGKRFYRMWKFYLLTCAASFRARKNQLWQIVLSKHGTPDGYTSLR